MEHVVTTAIEGEQVRHSRDGELETRKYLRSKAIIPCDSRREAEAIADAIKEACFRVGQYNRLTNASVMLRDEHGKACYFSHDYLAHVMDELTQPEPPLRGAKRMSVSAVIADTAEAD